MVQRDYYLNRLIRNMWNGEIKVITGIRRCGKSVLLFDLFYNYLLSRGTAEDAIVRIELDQRRYYKYRNPIVLCEYIESIITGAPEKQLVSGIGCQHEPHIFPERLHVVECQIDRHQKQQRMPHAIGHDKIFAERDLIVQREVGDPVVGRNGMLYNNIKDQIENPE